VDTSLNEAEIAAGVSVISDDSVEDEIDVGDGTLLEDEGEEGMVLSVIGASNDTDETIDAVGLKKDVS
jgi:hypothetical protein